MFDSPDDARRALWGLFELELMESIVAALVPAIVLAPAENERLGGTRLGGTPDLPASLDWPRPPAPDDPEVIARRGNQDAAAEMREHFARRLPYTFLAQIDLEEIAGLGAVAAPLPAEGRLLFFYDLAVGPWETSARVARVIWDRAPREWLKASKLPPDLAEAADRLHAQTVRALVERGFTPPTGDGNTYRVPALKRKAVATLRLPNTWALDIDAIPAIAASCRADIGVERELCDDYQEVSIDYGDAFAEEGWRRQQLLGSPMPEQGDPREEAVTFVRFDKPFLSPEKWAAHREQISAEARSWRLLLQVALREWKEGLAYGTVYFLIRGDDLAAHRFEGVVAVYQQS